VLRHHEIPVKRHRHLFPPRHQQYHERGSAQHRSLNEPGIRHIQEPAKHERIQLTGIVPNGQTQHHANPIKTGEHHGSTGLGGGPPGDKRERRSGNRRHTSFAAVFVSPEIDDNIEIEINPADLRVDVYRASGAGGQHVNRTESAVRITHLPTNIVVQSQNSRSQHENRSTCMKQLRAKLYELELSKRSASAQAIEDSKSDIGWGNQIRSYVLDQSRIKDLRTGYETSNTQAVLDGGLDPFLQASLKQGVEV